MNWDDGNNAIFPSGTNSEEARKFKQSKRGKWISRLPKFKTIEILDADKNLAMTHLKFFPIGILLGVIEESFCRELGSQLVNWINEYRMQTHLFDCTVWDQRWCDIVPFELHFTCTHHHVFFTTTADPMTVHNLTAS